VRRGGAGTPTCPCALAKLRWDEAKQNRLQRLNRQTDVEAGFALGQAVGATVESSWQEGVDLLADFREADAIRGIAAEQSVPPRFGSSDEPARGRNRPDRPAAGGRVVFPVDVGGAVPAAVLGSGHFAPARPPMIRMGVF